MSDLISRKETLHALGNEMNHGADIDRCGLDTAYDIVENLPSAEPESKWIPVTEALPEHGQLVLGWCGGRIDVVRFEAGISVETREKMKKGENDDPIEGVWSLSTGDQKITRSSLYRRSDEWGNNLKPYCWVNEPMVYFGQNVTAWMPLPTKYEVDAQ